MRKLLILALLFCASLLVGQSCPTSPCTLSTHGTYSWTVPGGVTSITLSTLKGAGGGGGGGGSYNDDASGNNGANGNYSAVVNTTTSTTLAEAKGGCLGGGGNGDAPAPGANGAAGGCVGSSVAPSGGTSSNSGSAGGSGGAALDGNAAGGNGAPGSFVSGTVTVGVGNVLSLVVGGAGAGGTTCCGSAGAGGTDGVLVMSWASTPTVAIPSFSPSSGFASSSTAPQTVAITSATSGATILYTVDGSTPAASSGCTPSGTSAAISSGSSIAVSANETVQALGCLSGDVSSAAASATYLFTDHRNVITDNFAGYYNGAWQPNATVSNTGIGYDSPLFYQLPLDVWETGGSGAAGAGKWQNIIPGYYATVEPDTIVGGGAVMAMGAMYAGGVQMAAVERVGEGYSQNQGVTANVHLGTSPAGSAGVAVRCSAAHCYDFEVSPTGAELWDIVLNPTHTGATGAIGGVFGGMSNSDGASLGLSVIGCTLYPTINGAMITGGAASYTVAGCSTSGQPGFVVQEPESASTAAVLYSSGSIYNFSAFNVGELAAGGYTAPSVGYQTYSNTFNSASFSIPYPQWMMTSGTNAVSPNAGWPRLLSPVAVSGGYAAGVSGVSGSSGGMQYEFREPFGVNQWQVFQWANSSWGAQTDGVFAPLRHRTEQPGALNGNCAAIGGSTATGCVDYVGYYPGIEPFNGCTATSTRAACASTKNEYIETPFGHITKITPLVSESSNNVITVTGSTTSVATGDWWLVEYNNGYLNTYCAQSPTGTLGSWQAAHAYTAGTALEIAGGMYQVAQTTGTSGATAPAWPTQWNSTTNYGNTVTDGGVKWMYYGDACPTTYPKFTRFIHAYDSDLLTGYGVPGMFETNFDYAAGALPMFRNWSAGTMGYGTGYPCTTAGMSCVAPMEYIPTSFLP